MKASLLMASTILLCAPSLWAADAPLSLEDNKAAIIGIQLLGIAACFIWIFGAAYLMFALIAKTIGLRVSSEDGDGRPRSWRARRQRLPGLRSLLLRPGLGQQAPAA